MRNKIRKLIEKEAEKFFEFPSDKKDVVTYTSCKLFAEHIYGLVNKELEEAIGELYNDWQEWTDPNDDMSPTIIHAGVFEKIEKLNEYRKERPRYN